MFFKRARSHHIDVEEVRGFTVVRFTDKKIIDEWLIQAIGEKLFQLVDEFGCHRILIDFSTVESVSSAFLGKLITLHRKVSNRSSNGVVALVGPDRATRETLAATELDQMFPVANTLTEAFARVGRSPAKPQSPPADGGPP